MDDRLCLLVIIGITEHGRKELVAVEDGCRESEASWAELLSGLRSRGLTTCQKLAIGALGFWKALGKRYPSALLGAQDREHPISVAQIGATEG